MEPAQSSHPDTVTNGAPIITPDLTSGTASDEPGTVASPTTTGNPGVIGRVKSLFGGGSDVAEPASGTAPFQPVKPTPVIVPKPGMEPAGGPDFSTGVEPNQTPWPPIEPALTPAVEGTSAGDLKTAPTETDFKRLAGDTAEGNAESNAPASDIADMTEMANKIRAAEGQAPLDLKLSGPDSSALLQSYILHGLTEGLSNDLSTLPLGTRISVLMAANRIAKGMGEKGGITLSQEQVDNFLETARQNGTIPSAQPTTTETTPTDPTIATAQPEFTPAISPTPDLTISTEPSSLGSTPPAAQSSGPLT